MDYFNANVGDDVPIGVVRDAFSISCETEHGITMLVNTCPLCCRTWELKLKLRPLVKRVKRNGVVLFLWAKKICAYYGEHDDIAMESNDVCPLHETNPMHERDTFSLEEMRAWPKSGW